MLCIWLTKLWYNSWQYTSRESL